MLRRGLWRVAIAVDRLAAFVDGFVIGGFDWGAHGPVVLALVAFACGVWIGGICG